jgi:hypothetical protein
MAVPGNRCAVFMMSPDCAIKPNTQVYGLCSHTTISVLAETLRQCRSGEVLTLEEPPFVSLL